jgi:hypothetical protein
MGSIIKKKWPLTAGRDDLFNDLQDNPLIWKANFA